MSGGVHVTADHLIRRNSTLDSAPAFLEDLSCSQRVRERYVLPTEGSVRVDEGMAGTLLGGPRRVAGQLYAEPLVHVCILRMIDAVDTGASPNGDLPVM